MRAMEEDDDMINYFDESQNLRYAEAKANHSKSTRLDKLSKFCKRDR